MNFDEQIDRRGTHASKWDNMEKFSGVSADDGIAMWVADMDFRAADCIQDAIKAKTENGIYGYFGDFSEYHAAINWWMENRHDWSVDPSWIFTTHGLCNGLGLLLQTFTEPGDRVALFSPVYHAFERVITSANRNAIPLELDDRSGRYEMDFDKYDAQMTGQEKMLILCSPHNPGGRIWTASELKQVAEFCERHDLLLVADEIHHDLIMPGHQHISMPVAAPEIAHRLIMMTAASKTFNTAGVHSGNVIIPDSTLRRKFAGTMAAFAISNSDFGTIMTTAAYSPAGAAWVDELRKYLDGNRIAFENGIRAIPGLSIMPLEATYLTWVNFAGTGMDMEEVNRRVLGDAKVVPNQGYTFGKGGESYLRFNIGTQRANVTEAVERLQSAFSDLQ
ncbi:MAG: MalY/PatB family protein [Marinosulfonomonas sp.]